MTPQTTNQKRLRAGRRVMLHGHAWRIVRVMTPGAGSALAVAEPAGGYDAAPHASAAGPEAEPWCVVVGGPNGAGKTTFALEYLPQYRALADRFLVFDNAGQSPVWVYEQSEAGETIMVPQSLDRMRMEAGL